MTGSRAPSALITTLVVLAVMAVLIGLGTWQLQRLAWKEDLLARMAERLAAPPVPLPVSLDRPADWDFRPVSVRGTYDPAAALYLAGRTRGGQLGYELIMPLRRDDGAVVLVNRGWVPVAHRDAALPAAASPVAVQGVARTPVQPSVFVPNNNAAGNQWFSMDLTAMAAAAGAASVQPVYLLVVAETPAAVDAPQPHRVSAYLPNNHLGYVITWYALAVTLAGIFVIYMRGRRGSNAGSAALGPP